MIFLTEKEDKGEMVNAFFVCFLKWAEWWVGDTLGEINLIYKDFEDTLHNVICL